MRVLTLFAVFQVWGHVAAEIRHSLMVSKLAHVKPVGEHIEQRFIPLTEFPPPKLPHTHPETGRRHLSDDCTTKPDPRIVHEGPKIDIFGEYYDDGMAKTVATVIIPDHIDHKHFEITTSPPYYTVGPIEAIGYHPSTIKGDHPSECEKIYQDHMDEQYTEEDADYSEESLEMARMPLFAKSYPPASLEERFDKMYSDGF